jgi:hypothetical protein
MGTSDSSALQCMKMFSKEIVSRFSEEYLRQPTETDLKRIMSLYAARGFPACIECIDCQHYSWEACRIGLDGQFKGNEAKTTLFLRLSQIRNLGYGMFTSRVQDRLMTLTFWIALRQSKISMLENFHLYMITLSMEQVQNAILSRWWNESSLGHISEDNKPDVYTEVPLNCFSARVGEKRRWACIWSSSFPMAHSKESNPLAPSERNHRRCAFLCYHAQYGGWVKERQLWIRAAQPDGDFGRSRSRSIFDYRRLFEGASFSPDRLHNRPYAARCLLTLVTACSDRDKYTLSKLSYVFYWLSNILQVTWLHLIISVT